MSHVYRLITKMPITCIADFPLLVLHVDVGTVLKHKLNIVCSCRVHSGIIDAKYGKRFHAHMAAKSLQSTAKP